MEIKVYKRDLFLISMIWVLEDMRVNCLKEGSDWLSGNLYLVKE